MTKLTWDDVGKRQYETGVDRGVLYVTDNAGAYGKGVPWNGLTTVTESPSGAESNPQYADNIKYLDLTSAEEFGATVEAFTYPPEFAVCDGSAEMAAGVIIGQQSRRLFGLSYRTKLGNDIQGDDYGSKIHLVYGGKAAPSEKAYSTINDSPEALTFSWELTTSPVGVTGFKPTALLTVDSTLVTADALTNLENLLYGTPSTNASLPLPAAVMELFTGGPKTTVNMATYANQPSFNDTTKVITLPAVTGVQWTVDGVNKAAGAQPALTTGQTKVVKSTPQSGYVLSGDDTWVYTF